MIAYRKLISVIFFIFLLSGCGPRFPTVQRAYVSPVSANVDHIHAFFSTVSPDGQTIDLWDWTDRGLKEYQLDTGEEKYVFGEYPDFLTYRDALITPGNLDWSPNGEYLGLEGWFDDRITPGVNRHPAFILDPNARTINRADKSASGFQYWSPFGTERYLAGIIDDGWGVFDMKGSAPVPLKQQYDFRQEKEVGGTGRYLWSKARDIPIASFYGTGIVISSFADLTKEPEYNVTVLNYDPDTPYIEAIFDPTGEYVLVAQWKCANTETVKCSGSVIPPVTENVTDSMLTLFRWRTGEKYELISLSQIDPKNVVASGNLLWSADGSTIVIGRYNASMIVLKIKYP
jgi:hypothetical protein